MKFLEWLLNGIVWCIHDIGRAIKRNPLTNAWRNIKPIGTKKPLRRSVLCAPSRREIINRMSDAQRKGLEAIRADIKKHGSVKICEFGRKQ